MARGRPPKPTEQKRREGNPGKRKLVDEVAIGGKTGELTPPPMTDDARTVWDELAPQLHTAGVTDTADAVMLGQLCEAVAMAQLARTMMVAAREYGTGLVVQQPSGRVAPDPHFSVWKDAVATARQLAEQFGLTPSARARLDIGKQTQAHMDQIDQQIGPSPRLRAVDGGATD